MLLEHDNDELRTPLRAQHVERPLLLFQALLVALPVLCRGAATLRFLRTSACFVFPLSALSFLKLARLSVRGFLGCTVPSVTLFFKPFVFGNARSPIDHAKARMLFEPARLHREAAAWALDEVE